MPLLKNAKKALRVSKRKQVINSKVRSQVKTATDAYKANPTQELLAVLFSKLDRAVKTNLLPKNRVARIKANAHKVAIKGSKPAAKKTVKKAVAKTTAKKTTKKAEAKKTTKKVTKK